jgi:hypothetical protein
LLGELPWVAPGGCAVDKFNSNDDRPDPGTRGAGTARRLKGEIAALPQRGVHPAVRLTIGCPRNRGIIHIERDVVLQAGGAAGLAEQHVERRRFAGVPAGVWMLSHVRVSGSSTPLVGTPRSSSVGVCVAALAAVGVDAAGWVGVMVAPTGVLVRVGVLVGVDVCADVGVMVRVGVGVGEGVGVRVTVGLGVRVGVCVGVYVAVGVGPIYVNTAGTSR